MIFLTDHPEKKNIVINENKEDSTDQVMDQEMKSIKFKDALCIPGVLPMAMSFFFIKFAMYGVYYWIPTYLEDHLDYSKDQAIQIYSLQSVGGIFGSVALGLTSDLISVRSPVHLVGCTVGAVCLCLITSVQNNSHTVLLTFYLTAFLFF